MLAFGTCPHRTMAMVGTRHERLQSSAGNNRILKPAGGKNAAPDQPAQVARCIRNPAHAAAAAVPHKPFESPASKLAQSAAPLTPRTHAAQKSSKNAQKCNSTPTALPDRTRGSPRTTERSRATLRRYPSNLGVDFRKLSPEALRTYVNRYRLDAAPDAPDSELAKIVSKHFEATPVDEEAIVARFFEHLDDVDAARAGENDTGVARVHEQVAAKVQISDENGSWILASVVRYDATLDAYAVQDEDDQKIIELPASRIRRLGIVDESLDELQKGERVVAIFPETTSFYRAMVSKAPKRGPGGSPAREVVLKFEDDEDDAGRTPHRRVSLRYVLRERPQAKQPRPPPKVRPPPVAKVEAEPLPATATLAAPRPDGQAWADTASGGLPSQADLVHRPGGATYSDMIAYALKKLPEEHGDFKDICKVIEQDFFEQLNWKLESDLRKTPVWKSSVRKILYSNARFRHNLQAADKNVFTFSAYA